MWERLLNPVRGNPILTRHLATTFTGPRLGLAILLVSAALVILYITLFTAATYGELSPGVTYLSHNGVLLGLLILLLPLKVSGIIEGPRINRAFDQIVVTGASPPVLYLGAWISGLAYAAVLLFVTIPFAACMVTFGDAEIVTMFKGYATLLAYSNVIIAVTLAFSVFGREWLSAPLAVVVLSTFTTLAFIPERDFVLGYPPMLAELSPIRLLVIQSASSDSDLRLFFLATHVKFLLWSIPVDVARPILWLAVMAIGALIFTVGPGHRFTPGFNNFGAVVLKGDRKRGILGRLRGGVTRKVEMAFFYENAPLWTQRWGYFIRYSLTALPVALAWVMLIGGVWSGNPAPDRIDAFEDWKLMTSVWVGGGLLAFWCLLSSSGRDNMLAVLPIGRFKMRAELLLTCLFLMLCGLLFVFEYLPIARLPELQASGGLTMRGQGGTTIAEVDAYVLDWSRLTTAMLILVVNLFLIARLASRLSTGFIRVRIFALLGFVVLLGIPSMLAALIHEDLVSAAFMPIANLSPGILHPSYDREIQGYAWDDFMMAHAVLASVLVILFLIRYVRVRRVATKPVASVLLALLAGAGSLPAQDANPKSPLVIKSISRGFGGATFSAGIDFYTAEVQNLSDATLTVRYWVEGLEERWGGESFVLSPRSTRTLRWADPPEQRFNRRRRAGGGGTTVVFRTGGEEIRSQPLDILVLRAGRAQSTGSNKNKRKSRPSEQHLFVGAKGSFPPYWMELSHTGSTQNLVSCPPRDIPVSARNFDGVEVIWMTAEALAGLNRQQQDALHHYLMLGGTVVFFGRLPSAELAGSGAWQTLLQPENEWSSAFGGEQLRHARLPESEDVLKASPEGSTTELPLLNLRHVGAGHLAHMAFAPALAEMPLPLRDDKSFWDEFDAALPRGGFPIVVDGVDDSWVTGDYSALFLLGGYYVVYTLGLSVGLFFFARRRRHRRRMWIQIGVVPVLFLGFVPLLIGAADSQPSLCDYCEIAYFHAGSTHGVAAGHVQVNSSGKRKHSVSLRGASPAVFADTEPAWRYRYYWSRESSVAGLRPVDLRRTGDGAWTFDHEAAPWTTSQLYVYDKARVAETVTGSANERRGKIEIEVDVPESLRDRELFMVVLMNGTTMSSPVTPSARGKVKFSGPVPKNSGYNSRRDVLMVHRRFRTRSRAMVRPLANKSSLLRVLFAVAPPVADASKPPVHSDDMLFERSVTERAAKRSMKNRVPRRRIRSEGGRYIESLDNRVVVFEIPIVN